jgi:hypothetical protein
MEPQSMSTWQREGYDVFSGEEISNTMFGGLKTKYKRNVRTFFNAKCPNCGYKNEIKGLETVMDTGKFVTYFDG